jgi:Hint domain
LGRTILFWLDRFLMRLLSPVGAHPSSPRQTAIDVEDGDCFGPGTRIATARGPVPVETLHPGDRVSTLLGGDLTTVAWIGRRKVNCARHPEPTQVWPVRIVANTFGEGAPDVDLLLSPDHAVYADRVLIPIRLLVNGRSIRQELADRFTYYQIELVRHDVLLANGMPAESYLDTNGRARFANAGTVVTLHPDFSSRGAEIMGCAPLVRTGPVLDRVRRRLTAELARRGRHGRDRHPAETSWPV